MLPSTTQATTRRAASFLLGAGVAGLFLGPIAIAETPVTAPVPVAGAGVPAAAVTVAPDAYGTGESFAAYARQLRTAALLRIEPTVMVPTATSRTVSTYKWKRNIITTTFWVGELPTQNNPTPNTASSWDPNWKTTFGGYDDPNTANRRGYLPKNFIPKENPFYFALPYNDVTRGQTKAEAPKVIPWFRRDFKKRGKSVVHNRWLAIRRGNRVAYAQWGDVGPFRTDHWQYVFGNERPAPNLNKGAGLDVSPAVRDYLRMKPTDVCDWRFVEANEVPPGPWRLYGSNNPFATKKAKGTQEVVVNDAAATTARTSPPGSGVPAPAKPAVKPKAATQASE